MARNELKSLEGLEAHLLRGSKFFSVNMDDFMHEFQLLKWITYSENFNPLLIEIGKWKGRVVDHPITDNKWGCTLRCLQMLVANALESRGDSKFLFGDNKRAREAPFGIQNIAEVGLKDFGVYPGEWYGINCMSLIIESLNQQLSPVPNFSICTFQDGNINFDKIKYYASDVNLKELMN
jgi:hypothetical protein